MAESSTRQHSVRVFPLPVPGVFGTLSDSTDRFEKHWHDVYGFGFLLRGAQKWWSGKGTVRGYAGDAICTNPGEVHDGEPIGGVARRWLIFSVEPEAMRSLASVTRGNAELQRPVMRDPTLVAAIRHLAHRMRVVDAECSADPASALAIEECLSIACTLLVSRHGTAKIDASPRTHVAAPGLRAVRDRLADTLASPPPLSELASSVGLSRFQLVRRFAQAYGVTPYAWLRNARVERARRLLQGDAPLAIVASESGFSDQSHMTRAFRRHFGFTPGAWRSAMAS